MPPPDGTDSPDAQLAARDEILQIMYWLRGEGLAKDVAAKDQRRCHANSFTACRSC